MSAVRAGVVGIGDVSIVHLEAIVAREGSELVGIAEVDDQRRAAAVERWGVPGYATAEHLIAAQRPDVVHVTTPHDQHAPVAIAALEAGVHVLLEKPLADSVEAGRAIEAALAASPAKLALCFQNRYNGPVRALRERLESGELGSIVGGWGTVLWQRTAEYYADRPWRGRWHGGGGGLLMNQAIHTLDLLQWLLGPVVTSDGTASTRALPIEVEDTAELAMTHASGARSLFWATLANSRNAPVEIEIETERAVATLRGDLTIAHADGRVEVVRDDAALAGGRSYWGASHALLIDDFHGSLGDPQPFWIGAEAGLETLTTIAAVYERSFPNRARAAAGQETA